MTKLKRWFSRLLCCVTGGHRYADIYLHTFYDCCENRYSFSNRCVKCGAVNRWSVQAKILHDEDILRRVCERYGN